MISKTVLITGATGNIGCKLRSYFATLGWEQRLLCLNPERLPEVTTADLSEYSESWAIQFSGVDAVIHLAGDPSECASWESVWRNNILTTENVVNAALSHGCKRLIYASSNWVMAGYRFSHEQLTTDLPPKPINPYGFSKLHGERLGAFVSAQGLSFIAFRIGYCQRRHGNKPGSHMAMGIWGQLMWLSDRDLCNAMERAVLCGPINFAVLNLMSNNPGMRWDIAQTINMIGYAPQDGAPAIVTSSLR